MSRQLSEPITKITTNLFTSDVEWFKQRYGPGWSEMLRLAVRHHVTSQNLRDYGDG